MPAHIQFPMVVELSSLSSWWLSAGVMLSVGGPLTMWGSFSSKPTAKKTHSNPLKESLI